MNYFYIFIFFFTNSATLKVKSGLSTVNKTFGLNFIIALAVSFIFFLQLLFVVGFQRSVLNRMRGFWVEKPEVNRKFPGSFFPLGVPEVSRRFPRSQITSRKKQKKNKKERQRTQVDAGDFQIIRFSCLPNPEKCNNPEVKE